MLDNLRITIRENKQFLGMFKVRNIWQNSEPLFLQGHRSEAIEYRQQRSRFAQKR